MLRSRHVVGAVCLAAGALGSTGFGRIQVTWTLEERTVIGSVDDPDHALTTVSHAVIGAGGRVFIAQPVETVIRVFDGAGRPAGTIGRRGRGPGEFLSIRSIGMLGDTLYVADQVMRRVSFFTHDGTFIRSMSLASQLAFQGRTSVPPAVPLILLADRTALVKPGIRASAMTGGPIDVPWLYVDSTGRVIRTLALERIPDPTVEIRSGGEQFFGARPFADQPLYAPMMDGTGIVVVERPAGETADVAIFTIRKIGLAGDTVFDREFSYRPSRMSNALVAEAVDAIAARLADRPTQPSRREIERALQGAGAIPRMLPPVTDVVTGIDGTIWIRREATTATQADWLVLDSGGDAIGTVEIPSAHRLLNITADAVVTTFEDSLDVPYLTLYRIRRSGR